MERTGWLNSKVWTGIDHVCANLVSFPHADQSKSSPFPIHVWFVTSWTSLQLGIVINVASTISLSGTAHTDDQGEQRIFAMANEARGILLSGSANYHESREEAQVCRQLRQKHHYHQESVHDARDYRGNHISFQSPERVYTKIQNNR